MTKARQIILRPGQPMEIRYRGKIILRLLGGINRYRESQLLIAMTDRASLYDWSDAAQQAIAQAFVNQPPTQETTP